MTLSQKHAYNPHPEHADRLIANFGRITVTLVPLTEPRNIYRDSKLVGTWPDKGYRIEVGNRMSGHADTLEAAKAAGEYYASRESNYSQRLHGMGCDAARAYVEAVQKDKWALMARYPYTPDEVESLRNSVHADILEPLTPDGIIRAMQPYI